MNHVMGRHGVGHGDDAHDVGTVDGAGGNHLGFGVGVVLDAAHGDVASGGRHHLLFFSVLA